MALASKRSWRSSLRQLSLLGSLLVLAACGGGSTNEGGSVSTGTVLLQNGPLTFAGQTNTHAIVGYSYVSPGSGQLVASPPVSIAPGDSLPLTLPSGVYNFSVTYHDGRSERLQAPPDQVNVFAGEVRTILFVY